MDSELIVKLRSFYDKEREDNPASGIKRFRKDNLVAEILLSQGDQFFSKGFFIDALETYNECLCFVQPAANHLLYLIHSKRALACMQMNLPSDIVGDDPDARLFLDHLSVLMGMAEVKLQDKFRLKLSYPSHEKIPFMANCLELRTTEEFGRHIVTNRDLKVGDVVMIEKPFVSCVEKQASYLRCANCMSGEKIHVLKSCPTCINTMYCSEKCQKEAWDNFHRFECGISADIHHHGDDNIDLAVRTFCKGLIIYGGLDEFQKYLQDHQETAPTAFDLDFTEKDLKLEFLALHNQYSDGSFRKDKDSDYYFSWAARCTHYFVQGGVLADELSSDQVDFILATFYRYINGSSNNSFGSVPFQGELGYSNLQLAMSLINHSCAPNALRLLNEEQILMIIRPVPKGTALSMAYFHGYLVVEQEARQKVLLFKYGFQCKCEACEKNYPMRRELQIKNLPGSEAIECYHGKPDDVAGQLEFAKSLAQFMQVHDSSYPCDELAKADRQLMETYCKLLQRDELERQATFDKYKEWK